MSGPADFVVVGGGMIGLAIARELQLREPRARIVVVEKEASIGRHASGRNSGVVHAGLYYAPGSLKARLCAGGARELAAYCEQNRLPLARVGKVIVPLGEGDDAHLDVLLERARQNGVRAELLNEEDLRRLEPQARSFSGRALHSPDTAIIDSGSILAHLAGSLVDAGVGIDCGSEVVRADVHRGRLHTAGGALAFGHLFNAAGLNADRVARLFDVGGRYDILPFRGSYYRLHPPADVRINGLIYPVPDLRYPFLGVHITKQIDGGITVGPTALPALGRENYRGLQGVGGREALGIGLRLARQYVLDRQGFRSFAHAELRRSFKRGFTEAARLLVPVIRPEHLRPSVRTGIRAQLVDRRTAELVMDFVVERGPRSTHVLNAVSPGFTSAFAFARLVVEESGAVSAGDASNRGLAWNTAVAAS